MSSSKPGDRNFLFYKLVLINKASVPLDRLPDLKECIIPDYPPLAIDGFYPFECKEVAMPDADDKLHAKGFALVKAKSKEPFMEFHDNFWDLPVSDFVNDDKLFEDMVEYKDMLEFWPSLCKEPSKKCWKYHCVINKVGLECKNDSYLALATSYGKKCINHFLDAMRNQGEYAYGSKEQYSCKNFPLWVNGIFKHKVDCRFYRLPYDKRCFGLKEIGILGKLYLDDLTWEIVDLVDEDEDPCCS